MHGVTRYITRHGRRIAVQEVDTGMPPKRKKKGERFAKVPLDWIGPAAKAVGCPAAIVLVYLKHLEWKHGPTFDLPNGWLERLGASRKIKQRVLRDLKAADLIRVERGPRKSPRVTML
jgi:hypothetical protein